MKKNTFKKPEINYAPLQQQAPLTSKRRTIYDTVISLIIVAGAFILSLILG